MLALSEDLRVGTMQEMASAATRSYLGDGRCVGWFGPDGVVIDAEIEARPVPAHLARRFGVEDFWARWTAAECEAKASGTPILTWLARHGLTPAAEHRSTYVRSDGILVAVRLSS